MAGEQSSSPLGESFTDIAREFSQFFQTGVLTSSYKPVLLKAILYYLKTSPVNQEGAIEFIAIDKIAEYFFTINFTLHKRFRLKQLTHKARDVKIYQYIDEHFADDPGIHPPDVIPPDTIGKIKKLLFRNVLYLLRQDAHIYDFYDTGQQAISLPRNIKDETEFKTLLRERGIQERDIHYIGIPARIAQFISFQRPILEAATIANLAIFLEKVNTMPNLLVKIMVADGTYHKLRNISSTEKQRLYEYQNNRCFYCGKDMEITPEADHFIPYDYLFDSQMWNIVGACQNCNRAKSNYIVGEAFLQRLKRRNEEEPFLSHFYKEAVDPPKLASELNALLEQHYRNGLMYFKQHVDFQKSPEN